VWFVEVKSHLIAIFFGFISSSGHFGGKVRCSRFMLHLPCLMFVERMRMSHVSLLR
jgi:hypothetical protein